MKVRSKARSQAFVGISYSDLCANSPHSGRQQEDNPLKTGDLQKTYPVGVLSNYFTSRFAATYILCRQLRLLVWFLLSHHTKCPGDIHLKGDEGMKSVKTLLAAAVLSSLWAAVPAHAIPITDFVNPADTTIGLGSTPSPCPADFTCNTSSLSFVHNITDNGFTLGDTITSATVAIHLTDGGGSEGYTYLIGLGQTETAANVPTNRTDTYTLSVGSLADLQDDGMIGITITITSANNDLSFNFADSTLTAQVTPRQGQRDTDTAVPVPSTLLLFGTGLTAFGWRFRRRG